MDQRKKKELERLAYQLRITGLRMVQEAHSGHIGGAFSLSEIMAVLYFDKMNIRPKEPDWEERDRFVLSKGHATVALYKEEAGGREATGTITLLWEIYKDAHLCDCLFVWLRQSVST